MKTEERAVIHLVFAFDGKMFPAACVAMKSAVLGNGGRDDFVLHVMNPGFDDAVLHAMRAVMSECPNAKLEFITVTPRDFPAGLPTGPVMAFARLLVGRPIVAPRVIYLDSDVLVAGNLRELWDMPFDGHALLAVAGHAWNPPGSYSEIIRFGQRKAPAGPYFNSGLLVIDMPSFHSAQDEIFDVLSRYAPWILDYAQGVLNYVFRGRIGEIPRHWNWCSWKRSSARAGVIHYQAPDRPWQYRKSSAVYRMWWRFFLKHVVPYTDLDAITQLASQRRQLPSFPRQPRQSSMLSRLGTAAKHSVGLTRICIRRATRARKRVMLFKSELDSLGDMVLMTGVVPHYRKLFPDATLEIICNAAAVDLMRATNAFDAVWPRSRLLHNGQPSWLNTGRSDIFISLRRTLFAPDVRWMSSFLPVKAIGFSGDVLNHRIGKLPAYRKLLARECELPDDGGGSSWHELDVQRKMLSMLGIDVPIESLRPKIPEAYVDRSMAQELEKLYDLDGRPLYVCCPCGSQSIRSYPVESWHRVFAGLAPCLVVLCATGSDWRDVLALMAEPPEGVTFINLAGQTDLPQLAGLLCRADAVLAVESGPMHMAIALERPLVAVCGRGHYGRFVPYPYAIDNARFLFTDCEHSGCNWNCYAEKAACVSRIDPDEVCDAMKKVALR